MRKIRLGLARCSDIHGYYFGVMLAECDPMLLQKKYYVVHYYASNIYDPAKLTMPKVPGFDLVKVWDYDRKRAETFAEVFLNKPQVCEDLEDLCEGVDSVFISNGERDGSDHLKLSEPFIKKGIPTFVDKPFSSNLKDAKAIVSLAEKYKTPIFNASILSYVPAAGFFKQRLKEIEHAYYPVPDEKPDVLPAGLGVIKGVGGTFSQELAGKGVSGGLEDRMAYLIHGVSLALNLFGTGVEWVEAMGSAPLEYLHLHLNGGVEVMILNTSTKVFPEACSFYASAYSKYGAVHSNPIGDPEFIGGGEKILKIFKEMVLSGKPPVPYGNFLEHIAVIEAGVMAQKKGSRVYLRDIMKA
ncbi:MAG: Gfo/Idh/MocA family oxidoreductase [Candidatus Omnitrophica bacterium]|nr:Gfo/Idh/MocA family oxidoreductase [Candidatus Omnitrophota bacterium]